MLRILFIALTFVSTLAHGLEIEPYKGSEISKAQWSKYHAYVTKELQRTRREYQSSAVEVFSHRATRTTVTFTMEGHEAHPAWVTRYSVLEGDNITVMFVGYYAGNQDAFKAMLGQYMSRVSTTKQTIKERQE